MDAGRRKRETDKGQFNVKSLVCVFSSVILSPSCGDEKEKREEEKAKKINVVGNVDVLE